jgi:alpha-1,2-mannosyltransferase
MPAMQESATQAEGSAPGSASSREVGSAPIKAQPRGKPNGRSNKKLPPSDQYLQTISAFYIYLVANTLAALYAPIQDCDEVFNYWEPTHYLNHAFGLQTWEYSPEYSIRSWLYIVIHAIVGKFGSFFSSERTFEFYFIRVALAFACAVCQSRLFSTISRTLNPRIGVMFILATLFSPGMFHASVAFLPSSFSMYTTMLGMAAFMDWKGGLKSAQGIMWFGIGAVVGWPFSGALIAPFVLEDIVLASMMGEASEIAWRYIDGTVRSLIVLVIEFS